jgi:hypothetical protein
MFSTSSGSTRKLYGNKELVDVLAIVEFRRTEKADASVATFLSGFL